VKLIPPAVRHAITHALADVAPLTLVTSPAVAIDQQHRDRVRDEGILVTFGPLVGVGDRVQLVWSSVLRHTRDTSDTTPMPAGRSLGRVRS
jgi:hypothetical protein